MSTPDNPPLSRRAARQAELWAQQAQGAQEAQGAHEAHDAQGAQGAQGARGGQPEQAPTRRERAGVPTSAASPPPSDVTYRTQVRPRVPHYDTPVATPLTVVPPAPVAPPAPAAYGADQVRRRDFRPPAAQTPATAPPETLEHTLSRREIRALRENTNLEHTADRIAVPEPAPSAVVAAPIVTPAQPVVPRPAEVPLSALSSASPPTGSHWSVGIDDAHDPFENTFSREFGSTARLANTNALVLPTIPGVSIGGPMSGTGEIIVTGMIELPRGVASTGAMHSVHESPDIDDLFEPGEFDTGPPDSAPVSALKAVSSQTTSHSLLSTGKRPANNTVTTVLVASTVVMAVIAIGLFVVAAVNGLL